MLSNGYLQIISQTGAAYDSDSNPVAASETLSVDIPCNIRMLAKAYDMQVAGRYVQARAIVTFDKSLTPTGLTVAASNWVVLKTIEGTDIGRYEVASVEPFAMINSYKLTLAQNA
jgi:hypothetical protein